MERFGYRIAALIAALALGVSAGACARAQARVIVQPTALEVPPPPPRIVEPILAAEAPPVEPVDGSQIAVTPPSPPPPEVPVRADAGPPAEPAPPEVDNPPAATPSATTLQTLPAEREQQVQRSVRANLDGALANLNRVEYQRLGADARVNYDQARRFVAQAEEALRARNFVFAATVADKAATLAAQLAGR